MKLDHFYLLDHNYLRINFSSPKSKPPTGETHTISFQRVVGLLTINK